MADHVKRVVQYTKVIACVKPSACSDSLLAALGHSPVLALKASIPTDVVHGAVTMVHHQPPDAHIIIVDLYEEDCNCADHLAKIRRPAISPSEDEIRKRIDGWKP